MSIEAGHGSVESGPGKPADPEEPEEPERPGKKWTLIVSGLVAVFVLLAAYDIISGGVGGPNGTPSAAGTPAAGHATVTPTTTASAAAPASVPTASASASASASAVSPSTAAPSASSSPKSSSSPVSSPAQQLLSIAAISAFGPDGTSDGDNPGAVSRVTDGSGSQPWFSQWYATPEFGNLKPGTGLLLDMGKPVTVSSVQLALGSQVGATVQVRVGDTAALADLSTVATATDVGGTVRLTAATRAGGRYVLVWFTRLPPNGQGNYQVDVYHATVDGIPGT